MRKWHILAILLLSVSALCAGAADIRIATDTDLARLEREIENRILLGWLKQFDLPCDFPLDPKFQRKSLDELLAAHHTQSIHRNTFTPVSQLALHSLRDRNIAATAALIPMLSLPHESTTDTYVLDVSQKAADVFELCNDARHEVPFGEAPCVARCAATLVAPQLAVTANHCVAAGKWTALHVVFGYQPDETGRLSTVYLPQDVFCIASVPRADDQSPDWAILVLDREVTGRAPVPIRLSGAIGDMQEVYTIGYPLGTPLIYSDRATVTENSANEMFRADIDTLERSSGSPVFNATDHNLEGIFVRGDEFVTVNGCRLFEHCPPGETYCAQEDVTRIRCLPLSSDGAGLVLLTAAPSHPCRDADLASR